jgi:hypothetical protein
MLSSAEIKRQILVSSNKGEIRKQLENSLANGGLTEGEVMEMGREFETLTKSRGWIFVEAYMMKRMNITGLVFGDVDADQRGIAKGYMLLMQYIDQIIKASKELLDKEKTK